MTNTIYLKCKEAFGNGLINWPDNDIRLIFIDLDVYTPDFENDEFVSDLPSGSKLYTLTESLSNKNCTLGVFDADDVTIESLTVVDVGAIVAYLHTGEDSTSRLLFYIDDATNLPFTSNGDNVVVHWPTGEKKIFSM